MTDDERLRREIAASLVHAIRYSISLNADLSELADSRIVQIIAGLEVERRNAVKPPVAKRPAPRFRRFGKLTLFPRSRLRAG
jgi:hypothetical protein